MRGALNCELKRMKEPPEGFEPPTPGFFDIVQNRCSTAELWRHMIKYVSGFLSITSQ